MNKMTEKQPDWIDNFWNEYRECEPWRYSDFIKVLQKHLQKESTYESGYQKWYEYCKKEMEDKHYYRRFWELARFLLTIPMWKVYWYASKDYILKIEKMPYMDAEKPSVWYVDDWFDERIDNKSSD